MKNKDFEQPGLFNGNEDAPKEEVKQSEKPENLAEKSLKEKIESFISRKEKEGAWPDKKISAFALIELAKEFGTENKGGDFFEIQEIMIEILSGEDRKYNLGPATTTAKIEKKDLDLSKRTRRKNEEEPSYEKKRRKLPPQQRGLPNGDL